jgi:hypothetical protein
MIHTPLKGRPRCVIMRVVSLVLIRYVSHLFKDVSLSNLHSIKDYRAGRFHQVATRALRGLRRSLLRFLQLTFLCNASVVS